MSEHRQLQLDVQPSGRKCTVRVDGESFPCDRAKIVSNVNGGITTVEVRYLKASGEPYHVKGRVLPNYVGPVGGEMFAGEVEQHYEPIDVDILIHASPRATVVQVNGEPFKFAHSVEVDMRRDNMTAVRIYYTHINGSTTEDHLIDGYMLPADKDGK